MDLSIIVIFHNMQREAKRTLPSLLPPYQTGDAAHAAYEVIAIDNGSSAPLPQDWIDSLGPQIRYHFHETASVSPVPAVNLGLARAQGQLAAVIVDGARLASPGLVHWTLKAAALEPDPMVGTLSWHLGPDVQNNSMLEGYDQAAEDALLDTISWPDAPERLFEISTLAQSSGKGYLGGMPPELSYFAMRRDRIEALGGFEPRFQSPGGGLVNHDFRDRALALPGITALLLLGEGVFHQFHGGVATNTPPPKHPMPLFQAEYKEIRGAPYTPRPHSATSLLGHMPEAARRFI